MKAAKEFLVIGVRDAHDNTWIGFAEDPSDFVTIDLMSNDGLGSDLRCRVYDIPECLEQGWQCTITKRTIEVEFPDMTTE